MKGAANKKKASFETIKQNIFNAKSEKERKMWELILKRLESEYQKLK